MNAFYNSSSRRSLEAQPRSIHPSPHPSLDAAPIAGTAAVLLVGTLLLSSFAPGRKLLQQLLWFFDRLLGGAAHTTTLPGPPGYPIVGNLFEMKDGHIQKISEWTKNYGDVIRVALGQREAVFINSHKALAQTAVQQGPAFQSRPMFKLFHSDFASSGVFTLGTSPWSDAIARTRKALSAQITPRLMPGYLPLTNLKFTKFVQLMLKASDGPAFDVAEALHRYATGVVMDKFMGTTLDDEMIEMLAETEAEIFRQRTVGIPAHDYVPILRIAGQIKYMASKALGLKSLAYDHETEKAQAFRKTQDEYIEDLLHGLKERLEVGDETPSILGNIRRQNLLNDAELLTALNTGLASGANLGWSLTWLVGYLANRPDLQEQAHKAIDAVYGGDAPDPHDLDRVEFVRALHTESSRMFTPARLGFPRESMEGASHQGHKIPPGMLVIMNLMACNRDPNVFDRPDEYLPERWLDGHKGRTDMLGEAGDKIGVPTAAFGAGRRVCPGIEVANRCIYASIVTLLHFFTWERQPLSAEEKKKVFLEFRADRECSHEMDALKDTSTPTEAQGIPWSVGIKFHCRDPEGLKTWLSEQEI